MISEDWPDDEDLAAAKNVASDLLAAALPRRWRHSQGVCHTAVMIGPDAVEECGLLARAAILHDIGYAPAIADTGFHALDGARHLQSIGMNSRVVNLVAHHSCAIVEAEERGLAVELARFPVEREDLVDALIFCDMTVSPDGEPVSAEARIAEVLERYGDRSVVGRFMRRAAPALRRSTGRVQDRLARARVVELVSEGNVAQPM